MPIKPRPDASGEPYAFEEQVRRKLYTHSSPALRDDGHKGMFDGTGPMPSGVNWAVIAAGYMAKRVAQRPDRLKAGRAVDIYSVSGCISENFTDYIQHWKHNGYWLFDSAEVIRSVAEKDGVQLDGTQLFYYEVYEQEFDGESWQDFEADPSFSTSVVIPETKQLAGFDVVTFYARNSPECSPLSCNSLADELPTNSHCLLDSFEEAKRRIDEGGFTGSEPGPYRILAVYAVDWPW